MARQDRGEEELGHLDDILLIGSAFLGKSVIPATYVKAPWELTGLAYKI